MAKNIQFDILARDLASQTFSKVGRSSDALGKKMGGLAKAGLITGVGAVVVGVAALGKAMVDGVKDAENYQLLQQKTAAVLKSTGNSAHITVKRIQEHAAALEHLSGVDEELIINSQNVLATFTQVQNKTGKGNKIFDQATLAALNMSSALGTDLQGATILVGKALNDPIKGLTALRRAGVSFDAQQIKSIKTLVTHGKTLQAQKLILGELTKEFGGAARAAGQGFAGSMARLKDTFQDAFRTIGLKMLPSLTKLANWFNNTGTKAIERFFGWTAGKLWPALKQAAHQIIPALKQGLSILSGTVNTNGLSWKKVGDYITGKIIPFLVTVARIAIPLLAAALKNAITNIKLLWAAGRTMYTVLSAVFHATAGVFLAVVGAIVNGAARAFGWVPGLGPKLKAAAASFNAFRDQVNRALAGIKNKTIEVYLEAHGQTQLLSGKFKGKVVPLNASGSSYFGGGLSVVGESGPELVSLPAGSQIHSNARSRQMVDSGPQIIQLVVDGKVLQQVLLGVKRKQGGASLGLA